MTVRSAHEHLVNRNWYRRRPLIAFVALAYGITWLILVPTGLAIHFDLISDDIGPLGIFAVLAPFGPAIAAFIVSATTGGRTAVRQLRRRLIQWQVSPRWYVLTLLGVPLIELLGAFVVLGMLPLDDLSRNWGTVFTRYLPNVLAVAIFTGLAEEPGWRGFALPRLQDRHGPLVGTAIIAVLWAGWHLPNLLFGGWMVASYALRLVATLASAFMYTWVYNRTGASLLLAIILHAAVNTGAGLVTWLLPTMEESDKMRLYTALALAFSTTALVLIAMTIGTLGYRRRELAQPSTAEV